MDDWARADPTELRIRLDMALEHNAMLVAEIAELRGRLHPTESAPPSPSGHSLARAAAMPSVDRPELDAEQPRVDASAPIETKTALFRLGADEVE
ncbi:hypothetical protein [Catenulispora subtropica]|uniref:Uncharacterized protein n=1 Tax=Catenulispora subtropica TaxID=450798 RepID=A0ABP5ECR0_9ACTN